MINFAEYQNLKQGGFVSIKLSNGPKLSGFAAQDLEEPRFVRLDGMIENEDGLLAQFALRVEKKDIEAIEFLSTAPTFVDCLGHEVTMDASLWPDMD